jgi:uncharacterized protein YjbJ (UPF0337 family)
MNKDQAKGSSKVVAGKVQQKVGKFTGNADQQIKGLRKQVEGRIQKSAGDAESALDDIDNDEK